MTTTDSSSTAANSSSDSTGKTIEQLNVFLRGEISAAETYRMALDKLEASEQSTSQSSVGLLREIQREHGRCAQTLRDRIQELGGEASDSSGGWGGWAKAVQGTMNLFGDASALKGLKEGEEHGLKDYQRGVDDIDPTSAELVQNQLVPAQQRHITLLDQLMKSVKQA